MNVDAVIDGLISYICLLVVLTFHEFAHAWTAWKCGDDTARLQGRVTLNPIAHMDLLGTVVLPLLSMFLGAANSKLASFIIGWGKPVPVNLGRLEPRRRRLYDTLISLAGPGMNLVLAVAVMGVAKGLALAHQAPLAEVGRQMAAISLMLCFFNLLPIPPLDGSHFLKNLVGMSEMTYWRLSQFGFLAVIIVLQIDFVRWLLGLATAIVFVLIERLYGM